MTIDLKQKVKDYEYLCKSIPDPIVIVNFDGKILMSSSNILKIIGYKQSELIGQKIFNLKLINKKDFPLIQQNLKKRNQGKKVHLYKLNITTKNGKEIVTEVNGSIINYNNQKAILFVIRDVTELDKIKQQLIESEIKFRLIFENSKDAIFWANNKTGIIINCNKAAENLLEKNKNEIINYHQSKLHPKGQEKIQEKEFKNHVLERKIRDYETEVETKFGKIIPVKITASLINIKNQELVQGVFRDITKEKEIDKVKTEFVSLASHQLKTPLSAINWYTEMLILESNGIFSDKQKKYLDKIYSSNQRMIDLINDLLNISRLELGTFLFKNKQINFAKIYKDIYNDLLLMINEKKIKVTSEISSKLPRFKADPLLISIILQNLFSNAIKYNKNKGKINIKIKKQSKHIIITVSDTGIGIPQNQQYKIFTKLFRADNAREIDMVGTGLGLYLTKLVVEKIKGKIWFKSKMNSYATFYVSIPISLK